MAEVLGEARIGGRPQDTSNFNIQCMTPVLRQQATLGDGSKSKQHQGVSADIFNGL